MNKFLVIHDTTGRILAILGSIPLPEEPVGVPFKWVEIPEGKVLTSIEAETGEPIFTDIPPSEIEVLSKKLQQTQEAIDFLIMNGGI